ncbi:hypothetical protein ASE00_13525 [Sphingomonas sp. Root710]|nr:hypothetical protein ASE00_13525 [Sphingomonas sp. Root710]
MGDAGHFRPVSEIATADTASSGDQLFLPDQRGRLPQSGTTHTIPAKQFVLWPDHFSRFHGQTILP